MRAALPPPEPDEVIADSLNAAAKQNASGPIPCVLNKHSLLSRDESAQQQCSQDPFSASPLPQDQAAWADREIAWRRGKWVGALGVGEQGLLRPLQSSTENGHAQPRFLRALKSRDDMLRLAKEGAVREHLADKLWGGVEQLNTSLGSALKLHERVFAAGAVLFHALFCMRFGLPGGRGGEGLKNSGNAPPTHKEQRCRSREQIRNGQRR